MHVRHMLRAILLLFITAHCMQAMQCVHPQSQKKGYVSLHSQRYSFPELPAFCMSLVCSNLTFLDIIHLRKTCKELQSLWDHDQIIKVNYSDYDSRTPFPEITRKLVLLDVFLHKVTARNAIDLDLSYNNLQEIPPVINSFHELRRFVFHNNQLTNPMFLAQLFRHCRHLQFVDLSNNELELIPWEIKYLTGLQYLSLWRNQLSAQSIERICKWCPSIQKLDLGYNSLKRLPRNLYRLRNLIDLRVDGNNLQAGGLNPLFCLEQLQIIDVSNNDLTGLPRKLSKFPHLRLVILDKNRFSDETRRRIRCAFWHPTMQRELLFH